MEEKMIVESKIGMEHGLLNKQSVVDTKELMHPAFVAAQHALDGITGTSDTWHKHHGDKNWNYTDTLGFYGYPNNIIAFCAPRGQGKTSAMLSYIRYIVRATTRGKPEYEKLGNMASAFSGRSEDAGDYKSFKNLLGKRFYALSPIDPTMLGDEDSVLFLVLGKLFQEIQSLWGKTSVNRRNNRTEEERQEILEKLQRCYEWYRNFHSVKAVNEDKDDGFTVMLEKSDIFKIKQYIWEVIQYFFELHGSTWKKDSSFLVVTLDDTDMQFENAYRILEEVRMYLSLPNVVVMMATHLDQLRKIIEQHYREVFHASKYTSESGEAEIHRMAAKYLDKLIPVSQTVYLPTMKLGREMGVDIQLDRHDDGAEVQQDEKKNLERLLFEKIYDKTGLAFIQHENYMHNLIPETLRGVQHLLRFVDGMEDVPAKMLDWGNYESVKKHRKDIEKALRSRQENLRLFESYFINDWCSSKLTTEDWTFIKEMDKCATVRRIQYAIKTLKARHEEERTEKPHLVVPEFEYSLRRSCRSQTVQIPEIRVRWNGPKKIGEDKQKSADYISLIRILDRIEKSCIKEEEFRFVFAVHTYFSIQFNKLAVIDQLNCLAEMERPGDVAAYVVPYCSLFPPVTGKQWSEAVIRDGKQLKVEYDKLPSNVQNLGTEPEALIKALMHFLPIDKEYSPYKKIDEASINLFEMQTRLIYIICNWDVQDQIIKYLTVNKDTLKEIAHDSLENLFGALKSAIITSGKQAVYPGTLSRDETTNNTSKQPNLYQNIFQLSNDLQEPEVTVPSGRTEEDV